MKYYIPSCTHTYLGRLLMVFDEIALDQAKNIVKKFLMIKQSRSTNLYALYVLEYEKRDHFAEKLILQYKLLMFSKYYLLYKILIF